jgi:hypothetical protein
MHDDSYSDQFSSKCSSVVFSKCCQGFSKQCTPDKSQDTTVTLSLNDARGNLLQSEICGENHFSLISVYQHKAEGHWGYLPIKGLRCYVRPGKVDPLFTVLKYRSAAGRGGE